MVAQLSVQGSGFRDPLTAAESSALKNLVRPNAFVLLLVAEVLVGLATDTTVYLSWRWERVNPTS